MQRMVLVIGASGLLGLPVARAFRESGFRVRVMGRSGKLLRQLFDDAFEISTGDAASQSVIDGAIDGCFGVHISVAHGPKEPEIVRTVVQAARRLGVKRISYVSGTSVLEENAWFPIVGRKLRAEKMLLEAGLGHTIFKPTWFMEAIPNFLKGRLAVCFGRGGVKLHFLAASDFAAVVAKAFTIDETENRSFRILGPESISLYEAIDRCRATFQPHIEKVTTMPFWVAKLVATLSGDAEMMSAVNLVRYFEQIREGEMSSEVERLFGKPETTLDRWLEFKKGQAAKE